MQIRTCEVFVTIVHRLELAAINGNQCLGEQIQFTTEHHKLTTYRTDRFTVVIAEICNRLEIRHQAAGQSHHLYITLGFALHATAGLNTIEVTVYVQLQQR